MNPETNNAMRRADRDTPIQVCPKTAKPMVMAIAAPKLAPAVTPSVYGLASGLWVMVWIRRPAKLNEAPTNRQVKVIGRRISQTMKAVEESPLGPSASAFNNSFKSILEEPTWISKITKTASRASRKAESIKRFRTLCLYSSISLLCDSSAIYGLFCLRQVNHESAVILQFRKISSIVVMKILDRIDIFEGFRIKLFGNVLSKRVISHVP